MNRLNILNYLISKYFAGNCNYLEIGVCDPDECFNYVAATDKSGVDPGMLFATNNVEFPMTSNEFFFKLERGETRFAPDHRWDVVFIDGLHTANQVFIDAKFALNHLSPNGFVVLHDCNPPDWIMANDDLDWFYNEGGKNVQGALNGSCWKAVYYLRTILDKRIVTVDTDHGVSIIANGMSGEKILHTNPFYEFRELKKDRKTYLGLISPDEFTQIF